MQQHLGLGAYDIGAVTHDYEYDYFGRLKRSLLQKGNASGQFEEVYLYNDAGELVCMESKKGTSGTRIKHARNSYYKTGPLKRSELGNRLQGLDYVYTIDGALKSLNHPQLNSADPGKDGYAGANSAVKADVFGFALDYYPADYVRSNTSISYGSSYGAANERYDGRIKGLRWNTRYPALGASAGSEHMYKYDYDWKQQLKSTEFGVYTPNSTTNNAAGAGGYASPVYGSFAADAQSRYKEDNLSYDLNGNLGALRRYGVPQGSTPTQMDNLTAYILQSGTNRLSSVTEASAFTDPAINDVRPQAANNYTYYDNGALKTDLANDLSLEYNAAGLTTAVRNAAGTQLKLSFVYDEQGQRVRKVEYTAGMASKTTLYLRGPEGGLCAVYEAPTAGAYVQKELLLDGGALGTYFGDQVNRYVYALTDLLGNVRATVDRDLSGGAVQQLSYADYYAWGMPLPGREAASSPRYRLGYQGQEYESKVGLYGFGLRLYDQRLGRWLSADPYGQHWSPYLAMSNNPVSFVDADGGWSRSLVRVEWGQLFDNAEYGWYSYNNRWGAFNEWSGSRFNSVQNPVQGHDYSQMSKEILRVSEQVAPDDIYMYIGGVKVKVSDFGGRDFTLTYGSDGALLASESRFPAVMVPQYREMVSGIPISKMTPAELLVAQALEVPVSDVTGLYKVADRFGAIGSLIINIGLTGGLGVQAQTGNLAVRAAQASVASSRAVTAMMMAERARRYAFVIDPRKFNYFFGRVVTGSIHNIQRSAQNLKDLTILGINTETQLMNIFRIALEKGVVVATKTSQYGTTVSKSINIGDKGRIVVGFFYKGGNMSELPSISTIIPKIF